MPHPSNSCDYDNHHTNMMVRSKLARWRRRRRRQSQQERIYTHKPWSIKVSFLLGFLGYCLSASNNNVGKSFAEEDSNGPSLRAIPQYSPQSFKSTPMISPPKNLLDPAGNKHYHHHGHGHTSPKQRQQNEFLDWCIRRLGISTMLEIQTFEYYDYLRAMAERTDAFCEDCRDDDYDYDYIYGIEQQQLLKQQSDRFVSVQDYPRISVRGLAAKKDIAIGDVVLRIPYSALLTVTNVIDRDPVLSQVLGKEARKKYGWNAKAVRDMEVNLGNGNAKNPTEESLDAKSKNDSNNNHDNNDDGEDENDDSVHFYYEMPLLAVALLHHVQLGPLSPLAPYIELLQSTPVQELIPIVWSKEKLRVDANDGVRRVVRGIQRDVREMYTAVLEVLIQDHPHLFGDPNLIADDDDVEEEQDEKKIRGEKDEEDEEEDHEVEEEWMFSFEKFQWAFALVNSRHFYLPLTTTSSPGAASSSSSSVSKRGSSSSMPTVTPKEEDVQEENALPQLSSESPPASTPTEDWVAQQQQNQRKEKESKDTNTTSSTELNSTGNGKGSSSNPNTPYDWPMGNSFLAPVADLLNFGPPCTRGYYNEDTQSFEIVAMCSFSKGQEVTFWYSDACDDVIVANYGFTHPMVPKCPTLEDWKRHAESQRKHADLLYQQLENLYDDLDRMDIELERVHGILNKCDCCRDYMARTNNSQEERRTQPQQPSPRTTTATPTPPRAAPQKPKESPMNHHHNHHHNIRGDQQQHRDNLSRGKAKTRRKSTQKSDKGL